jgi:ACR3 family arsenite efflux pump ArsB
MKIELYMIVPLLVGLYSLRRYLTVRKRKDEVYKIAAPVFLMISLMGFFLFLFFIFNS